MGGKPDTGETKSQRALLQARIGAPGSGGARYAAAMYFYGQGVMPADMLEIYRICSKFDFEDPADLARYEGVEIPPVSRIGAAGRGG